MAPRFDRDAFVRLLDELRLDDADELLRSAGTDRPPEATAEVAARRAAAERDAQERYQRIIDLSQTDAYEELAGIRDDPSTRRLLAFLPETTRERAELYLRQLDAWERASRATATRRLAEARKALAGLDLELARGLLARVDGRFLDERQREARDELLLEVSARAMELEAVEAVGDRMIHGTPPKPKRWWRRG